MTAVYTPVYPFHEIMNFSLQFKFAPTQTLKPPAPRASHCKSPRKSSYKHSIFHMMTVEQTSKSIRLIHVSREVH